APSPARSSSSSRPRPLSGPRKTSVWSEPDGVRAPARNSLQILAKPATFSRVAAASRLHFDPAHRNSFFRKRGYLLMHGRRRETRFLPSAPWNAALQTAEDVSLEKTEGGDVWVVGD